MFQNLLLLILGLILLYKGADWLIDNSVKLAKQLRVSSLVIGVTIIAMGTSAPEMVASIMAAGQNNDGIAIGNIIGTVIANIALILGLTALIFKLQINKTIFDREAPFLLLSSFLILLLSLDGKLSSNDGLILLLVGAMYFYYLVLKIKVDRQNIKKVEETLITQFSFKNKILKIAIIVASLAMIIFGAKLLVDSAVNIAHILNINAIVIAITVVAIGTSLPELVTCLMSSRKKNDELSVANILGSNLVDVFFGLGLTAFFFPLVVDPTLIQFHMIFFVFLTGTLIFMLKTKYRISRIEGAILLIMYSGYIAYSVFLR